MSRIPTKWNSDRCREAYELALLGHTDKEIAKVMDIDINTLDDWKREKPGFMKWLKKGKEESDREIVVAFRKTALGYFYEEEEVHVYKGEVMTVKVKKFQPGDKWAQARWLALRQKEKWSETTKIELNQTNININNLDLKILSTDQLLAIKDLGLNMLQKSLNENAN